MSIPYAGFFSSLLEGALDAAHRADDALRASRLLDVLAAFGELTISTIHRFCLELLRRESLEAGFAPASTIGEDGIDADLFQTALREWTRALRARRPELWTVLDELVSDRQLADAVRALHRHRDYADVIADRPFDLIEARRELARIRDEIRRAATDCLAPAEDKLLAGNGPLMTLLDAALARSTTEEAVLAALLSAEKPYKAYGKAKDWRGDGKERFKETVTQVSDWRDRVRERIHGELVRDLRANLLPRITEDRRLASLATFDDLLADAARLLRENADARARLAARYRCVLIDEVQDTDPIQAEVAALLTRALECGGPWHEHPPLPGRLFAVGDPRQSIYRFRGADVDTFGRLESLIPAADRISLNENFRSVPGIVAWVNHTFADLPGFAPQRAHRAKARLEPVVLLEADDDVDEVEGVIRHLRALLDGRAEVVDRSTGGPRPIAPRDVMVVLPGWTQADGTADRLRAAGLECSVQGGTTFFKRDEVRLGLGAIRAIAEPADTEAVVFVLRGLFGLSHEELAHHVAAGGSFRYTLPAPPPGAVANALGVLLRLHRERGTTRLAVLLDQLLETTRAPAVWSLLPDGAGRLANLDKLRAMIDAAEATATSLLGAVAELVANAAGEKDIDRIDDDGDAIRITSLFKAKGLEAPVVVFMHARRKENGVTCVVDHGARTVAVAMGDLCPLSWEQLEDAEKDRNLEERRRWTYVATTRARDQLVVCRSRGGRAAGDLLAHDLQRGLPQGDALHEESHVLGPGAVVQVLFARELPSVERNEDSFPGLDAQLDALLASPPAGGDPEGDAWSAARRAELRAATRGCVRWRAASPEPGASLDSARWSPGEGGPGEGGVGARGGDVVHAVMERLDLSRPHAELVATSCELVELLGTRAALPEETLAACRTIVERILLNPQIERARRASERWHEVPFTYSPRRGTVISGTIDLCFPVDASRREWIVFDWKSRVPARTERLHERYREQLRQYAQALLANLRDVRIVDTQIVGPHAELGIVGTVDDVLADVRGDLRARLGELIERGAPMPRVGYDAGDPAISVELCWEDHRLAIAPDATDEEIRALEAQGWTVRRSLDDETGALLGLDSPAAEDA